ncbi:SPO22-domain-containing protein [Sistotremastrum niveocremeum HHB9708]|uniref:SPO22-domain-containing protein n=1 Tax=Sistotremastrum niveocremeum HHB9708 TaxID=1314777 RepID=A0A164R3Y4_9AGAM|nr:SPO22-domain-containing protein [Sistotremastrum niveocremeum HHB9708]
MSMTPLKRKNPASDKDLLDAYNAIQGTLLFSYRSSALRPFQHPKICRYIPTPGLTPRFPYSDRLLRVKPKLASTLSSDSSELLIGLFNEIASLAASILLLKQSGNKASTGKAWTDVTDFLDREALIHVLLIASKTGAAIAETGQEHLAIEILTRAADFEQLLSAAPDPDGLHEKPRAAAVITYYASRMETSQDSQTLETEDADERRLSLISSSDREYLAAKVLELGKLILRGVPDEAVSAAPAKPRSEGKRAEAAVKWFQKALWVVEKLDDADTPGVKDLKRAVLRGLARSYFLSSSHNLENLTRAEATLHELVSSGDVSDKTKAAEFQQLRWMRVAVLKRKNVDDQALREAYQSIIDGMTFSEESVAELIQEVRGLDRSLLVTSVLQYCLKRSVELADDSGHPFAERLLLALILHCSRDQDTQRGMKDLEVACGYLGNSSTFVLPKVPSTACQSLLWQCADRQYVAKNWISAAEWYLLATHGAFQSMAQISYSKCFRKAALCYVEAREFAMASTVLRRCPGEEAATHYVMFLAAAHQGMEDEAISAIHDMVKCPDFNRDMLLLATQLAHESNMKSLLLAILQALLKTLQAKNGLADEVEAVTLIRCIIRLVLELLKEPAASIPALVEALIGHFQTALELCKKACSVNRASFILKDVSWLWRTAYNTAVSGCADWDDCELAVSNLFDVALDLMDIFSKESVAEPDVEMYGYKVYAAFAAVSGKVFTSRGLSVAAEKEALQKRILTDIAALRILIQGSEKKSDITSEDKIRFGDVLHACFVFEMELLCELQEWGRALTVIQNMSGKEWANLQLATFEAIADILWVAKSCPIPVLYQALEAIIHTCLDRNTLSIKKFSRWLRTICSFLLAHNTTSDRQKALNYMREAVALLEDNADADDSSGDAYPPDERQWLMSTSYNTGIECLSCANLNEAKQWFETATTLCRFLADGQSKAEKISSAYTGLLARYTPLS